MKILLINHFPLTGSGSGVYTTNIAVCLQKQGHEVCIIMPENQKVESNEYRLHPVYFKDKEVIKNQLPFNFPCFTTHPRSNKTFYDMTDEEIKQYMSAFRTAIEQEIKNFKPDIIHAGHIWILSYIASNYDIPLIITAHGTDLIGYNKSDRFKEIARDAFRKASYIITISLENYNLVCSCFDGAKDKTVLIPNGYNADVFYPEKIDKDKFLKQFGINKHYDNIVSFAGKFTHFKGIDILIKAASIYNNKNTLTILAGSGELFENMKKMAKKYNIDNITFIGNQPHNILRKLYNVANVSIVPSRNEAFGLVVIEALACGTPVIGTNNGGIVDIINDKVGLFIKQDDWKDLANKITLVLDGKTNFDNKYIAHYAKEKYSQDRFVKKLIDIYNKARK